MTFVVWPPVYQIKRHRRARGVKLRAESRNGLVVTIPYRFNLRDLPSILDENKTWIIKQLQTIQLQSNETLPTDVVFHSVNTVWKITYQRLSARLRLWQRLSDEMVVMGDISDERKCKKLLSVWARRLSSHYLAKHFHEISQSTGISYNSLTIRNQKTVWGSCTSLHAINLNYKLYFLPERLVNYVMIHELCHTRYLNHSDKFWQLVEKHDPDWKQHRSELRKADKYIPGWIC